MVGRSHVVGIALLIGMLMVPAASAHPEAWRGFGTAAAGAAEFELEFMWIGTDVVIVCEGGGCLGAGDGSYILSRNGVELPAIVFSALEDSRNPFFATSDECPSDLLMTLPNYSIQSPGRIDLHGVYQFCFSTGIGSIVMDGTVDGFTVHVESDTTF